MPKRWLFFLIVFACLRLVFWFTAFPNPDEAYYWLWGKHPDLSYYDHPPLNAWIQGVFSALFGRSRWVLRLPNLLSNSVFFYTYYRLVRYLYGENVQRYFWMTVLLILASPLYFLFLSLAWHDHWLITFSLISAYLFVTFLDSYVINHHGESWRLYGAALAIGLAGLCKYNAAFVVLGFVAVLIVDSRVQSLLRDRRLYLASAIAALALVPVLLWNVSNHFQSFHYYFSRSIQPSDSTLKIGSCLTFLGSSFLVVSPFYWKGFNSSLRTQSQVIRQDSLYTTVAFWIFAISSVLLTILSLISAALYYWNITAYLLLFPLLPAVLTRADQPSKPSNQNTFLGAQIFGSVFAFLLIMHYCVLPLSALVSRDADPDTRMLFGWNDVATVVQTQAITLKSAPLLITTDYRSASALAYQLNDKTVMAISDRVDQFDFWNDSQLREPHSPQSRRGRNAVILSDDWFPVQAKLFAQFDRVTEPVTVPVTRFGVWIKNYYVQIGYKFKDDPA